MIDYEEFANFTEEQLNEDPAMRQKFYTYKTEQNRKYPGNNYGNH